MKTILICDDHQLFANAIATCLKELNYIVSVVNSKTSCLQVLRSERFHVFICDLNLNSDDGFELLNETKKELEHTKIIILTSYDEPFLIEKAKKSGVDWYLLKDTSLEKLVDAIENTNYYSTNLLTKTNFSVYNRIDNKVSKNFLLSPQEKKIVQLILNGKTSQEIANELFISKKTVDTHRSNINRKLEISNATSLVQFAKFYI